MKEKKIFIPIWNYEIILIYGNNEEIQTYLENKHKGLDISKYLSSEGNHFKVIDNNIKSNFDYFVIYEGCEETTISHESLHIAWEILNSRLVAVNYDNQEPLAYLMDYISNEVLIQLNEWK